METADNKQAGQQPMSQLTPRGLRSRKNLKDAARSALNARGYHKLRVQDITQEAGVADGLFYRYFRDLHEIVFEITDDLFRELIEETVALPQTNDAFGWIMGIHRVALEKFSGNPGVLACMFGLAGEYRDFSDVWKTNAHEWNVNVGRFLERKAGFSKARAKSMAYVLGAMTEGVIYQSLVRGTEDLVKIGKTPEEVAEVISVMWYRAIFLDDPPAEELRTAGKRLLPSR